MYIGQASDCVDRNIQTIAAGPSQCLIMDILNDVMQIGLECIAGKGLHKLGVLSSQSSKSHLVATSVQRPSQ